ncbi:MAG TPA: DUF692 family protein [Capsulimonadaceae bacterium]|nr:DUF692 family protein [Capsulimonadaceae bacterium]
MKVAINYSPAAASLVKEGKVDLDLFKCPSPFDSVVRDHAPSLIADARSLLPVYIHFPLHTGGGRLYEERWDDIARICTETETPNINLHLGATRNDFPGLSVDADDNSQVTEWLMEKVQCVAKRFGYDKVIVENVVYRGSEGETLQASVEPETISNVLRETGCGLLLDTAHAMLTSQAMGIDPREYISRLPLDRLRELHVTGVEMSDGNWRDSMPMRDDDWALCEWVLARIHAADWPVPWAVALEYGGVGPKFEWRSDRTAIYEQIARLHQLVHAAA